ncbi:hypothetical protein ACIQMR_31770 [Streptomyces sp. NPDC091376]|uniref:hypothetical protein n=1 Tax=Streptomyces sp. NPDC091376 TaxID=3365994 RepID=UPI0038280BF1
METSEARASMHLSDFNLIESSMGCQLNHNGSALVVDVEPQGPALEVLAGNGADGTFCLQVSRSGRVYDIWSGGAPVSFGCELVVAFVEGSNPRLVEVANGGMLEFRDCEEDCVSMYGDYGNSDVYVGGGDIFTDSDSDAEGVMWPAVFSCEQFGRGLLHDGQQVVVRVDAGSPVVAPVWVTPSREQNLRFHHGGNEYEILADGAPLTLASRALVTFEDGGDPRPRLVRVNGVGESIPIHVNLVSVSVDSGDDSGQTESDDEGGDMKCPICFEGLPVLYSSGGFKNKVYLCSAPQGECDQSAPMDEECASATKFQCMACRQYYMQPIKAPSLRPEESHPIPYAMNGEASGFNRELAVPQESMTCYAAATATACAWATQGQVTPTLLECMDLYLFSKGCEHRSNEDLIEYAKAYQKAAVSGVPKADVHEQIPFDLLHGVKSLFGRPKFPKGVSREYVKNPDVRSVVRWVDEGKILMIGGSDLHWRVIYGYLGGETVELLKFYNPGDGGGRFEIETVEKILDGDPDVYVVG